MGFQNRLTQIGILPATSGNPAAPSLPIPTYDPGGLQAVNGAVPINVTSVFLAAPGPGLAWRVHSIWAEPPPPTTGYCYLDDVVNHRGNLQGAGLQLLGGLLFTSQVRITNKYSAGPILIGINYDQVAAPFS
jgi:hypothetical protein